ncbi:MAG TPA: hypothetical protein PKA87_12700 [Microthrixaceae bacterium]|nr:hypothetical protein [Microthrixaceae bacterium]RTL09189.1 MAG: hypothetical protein EKK62_03620 [Acidimicrobiia bacterium]MCO5306740.1 hypothetical protein [Microthrixaceae bacterium]HMX08389.1 hypothetical protein [Microthrixaceae bacterium]HMY87630.1 hypothetical protein [Microthrixaceae bacterium]
MESDPITPDAADRPDARPPAAPVPAEAVGGHGLAADGMAADGMAADETASDETAGDHGTAADELVLLTSIEEDLAAVDAAMAALDGIDTTTMDGATAAAQVEAIAGRDRFDPTDPTAPTAPAARTV